MRVVAGKFKGRQLVAPKSGSIRPTSDRARETIFNILQHGCGIDFSGKRVLDLFAGTGALGIEALSRGAGFALFVEDAAESRALIRSNVEALGLTGCTKIYRRDASRLGPTEKLGQFDIALLDPPYGKGLGEAAMEALANGGWLRDGAVLVLEERKGAPISLSEKFEVIDERILADTQLIFARLA